MDTWKLEEAKNRFSEVVRRAMGGQPQRVTRSGKDAAVVISAAEYERLTAQKSLVWFIRESPLREAHAAGEMEIERDRDTGRDVPL